VWIRLSRIFGSETARRRLRIVEMAPMTIFPRMESLVSSVWEAGLLNWGDSCWLIWMNALVRIGALCMMRNSKGRSEA
jgi:hypothetical protein